MPDKKVHPVNRKAVMQFCKLPAGLDIPLA